MPNSKRSKRANPPKEWTLMFFFASDNPLAPGILSQLKSIQQAGFHPQVNVIAQYDPQTERAPLHVFDVNKVAKLRAREGKLEYQVGFKPNAFVPNLVLDKLWAEQQNIEMVKTEIGRAGAKYRQPLPPGSGKRFKDKREEPSPKESLKSFLKFCRESYPAKRYMLFILGHGLVVGNDMFLFDEHAAERSVSLNDLGRLLRGFRTTIEKDGQQFEALSFHSCSMSALEVAYQLNGTANYMLASQGPAFVGSWPYRQILMRVFQDTVGKEKDVKNTLQKIFTYCLYNSRDFQLAGYSFDLSLCDLNKVPEIKAPLRKLSATLAAALAVPLAQECILLAHWDAQSYWGESYTDLYDFCLRLNQRCEDANESSEEEDTQLVAIQEACDEVMKALQPGDDKLIINSGFAGAAYQYSHGLSVFFPWSEPIGKSWPSDYASYRFKETKWIDFLDSYFKETMRAPRGSESSRGKFLRKPRTDEILLDRMAGGGTGADRSLAGRLAFAGGKGSGSDVTGKGSGSDVTGLKGSGSDVTGKGSGSDVTGKGSGSDATGDMGVASLKNYPPYTLASNGRE